MCCQRSYSTSTEQGSVWKAFEQVLPSTTAIQEEAQMRSNRSGYVCLSFCLSVSLSVFVCLSVCWSFFVCLSVSICCPVFLSVSACLCFSVVCLSVCLCLSVCFPVQFCFVCLSPCTWLFVVIVCLFFPSSYVYSSFSPSYLFTIVLVKLLSFPKCDLGRCFDERKARAFQGLIMKQYGKCETWSSDVRKKLKCFMKNLPKKCIGKMVSKKTPTKSTHSI